MDPSDPVPSVTAELSWRRSRVGKTAILLKEPADQGWDELARVDGTTYRVGGIQPERSTTFAAAAVLEDGGLVPEELWDVLVWTPPAPAAGGPALPDTPSGFSVAQDGGFLNLAWDAPSDGVTEGMEIRVGAAWEDGRLVARDLAGGSYSWPWWASGSQTFWLKGQDRLGRYSLQGISRVIDVKALDDHLTANTWSESGGGFGGTKTNMEVVGGALLLTKLAPFGGLTAPFASYVGLPPHSRYWHEGTYLAPARDLGQVENERLEVAFAASQPVDANLPFGAIQHPALGPRVKADGTLVPLGTRGLTSKTSWRGTPFTPLGVQVEVNTSPTNTANPGLVVWDGWRPYVPGTYRARWVQFRVTATGDGLRFVRIPTLVIKHRRLNKKDEGLLALPGGAPAPVVYAVPFVLAPQVTVTIEGAWPGIVGSKIEVTARTAVGCNIEVFNGAGASVATQVCWHALGT